MSIFWSPIGSDRATVLLTQALSNIAGFNIYTFDADSIEQMVGYYNPNYIVLNDKQYKDNIQKIDSLNKNFHTKIITTNISSRKSNKLKTIQIDPNSFSLYNEYHTPSSSGIGSNYYFCDLDNSNPSNNLSLESITYPKFKTNIVKLVNCPTFNHPQNIGIASEQEILNMIHGCDIYINISNQYIIDALMMDKKILNLSESNNYADAEIFPKPEIIKTSEVIKKCVRM
jgi:hypothetical protein